MDTEQIIKLIESIKTNHSKFHELIKLAESRSIQDIDWTCHAFLEKLGMLLASGVGSIFNQDAPMVCDFVYLLSIIMELPEFDDNATRFVYFELCF